MSSQSFGADVNTDAPNADDSARNVASAPRRATAASDNSDMSDKTSFAPHSDGASASTSAFGVSARSAHASAHTFPAIFPTGDGVRPTQSLINPASASAARV